MNLNKLYTKEVLKLRPFCYHSNAIGQFGKNLLGFYLVRVVELQQLSSECLERSCLFLNYLNLPAIV